jgi:hypothetical protein
LARRIPQLDEPLEEAAHDHETIERALRASIEEGKEDPEPNLSDLNPSE